jgi:hypothetical protein
MTVQMFSLFARGFFVFSFTGLRGTFHSFRRVSAGEPAFVVAHVGFAVIKAITQLPCRTWFRW